MRITTTYDELTASARRSGPCPGCGKKTTRNRTFGATVSPFNRGADGVPRSRAEVREQVNAKAAAWAPDAEVFRHEKCAP